MNECMTTMDVCSAMYADMYVCDVVGMDAVDADLVDVHTAADDDVDGTGDKTSFTLI